MYSPGPSGISLERKRCRAAEKKMLKLKPTVLKVTRQDIEGSEDWVTEASSDSEDPPHPPNDFPPDEYPPGGAEAKFSPAGAGPDSAQDGEPTLVSSL